MEVNGQFHALVALPQAKKWFQTHWIENWMNLRTSFKALFFKCLKSEYQTLWN
jgi:hypothetical protein